MPALLCECELTPAAPENVRVDVIVLNAHMGYRDYANHSVGLTRQAGRNSKLTVIAFARPGFARCIDYLHLIHQRQFQLATSPPSLSYPEKQPRDDILAAIVASHFVLHLAGYREMIGHSH